MAVDIREIDPCEVCMRKRRPFDFGDHASRDAGAYITISALEVAANSDEVTPSPDDEQAMSSFLYDNYGLNIPHGAKGAVGHCGRAIGRGACIDWQVDAQSGEIKPKSDS